MVTKKFLIAPNFPGPAFNPILREYSGLNELPAGLLQTNSGTRPNVLYSRPDFGEIFMIFLA
jgi:hypothetical protein